MNLWKKIILPAILLVALDAVFLTLNRGTLTRQIIDVQRVVGNYKFTGIILCYILMIFALCYFIIIPRRSVLDAFLLGIVINGVFETTNYSIFKKWRETMVLVDTLWGGALYGLTTFLTFYFERSHIMDSFK
jgi:uncharacterized membrane protein